MAQFQTDADDRPRDGCGRVRNRIPASRHFQPTKVIGMLSALVLAIVLALSLGVPVTTHAQENLIRNPDFTLGMDAGDLPLHWTRFGGVPGLEFMLTDERATVGELSLKLVDENPNGSVGLRSHQVPAKAGQRFLVEVDVFVERGTAMVYLDFHNAQGQRIVAQTTSTGISTDWQTVSVEATAPEGTSFVTIILYSSLPNIGTLYFDNVRLYDVSQRPITLVERTPTNRELGFLPADGAKVNVNPPPLVWLPTARATSYTVELSQDPTFPAVGRERIEGIELPLYTHSRVLESGTWYWRYWAETEQGIVGPSQVRSFVVTEGLTELPLPPTKEWMARIPKDHPRIFLRPEDVQPLRERLNVRAMPALFTKGHLASLIGADLPPEPVSPYATGALDIEVWRAGTEAMIPVFDTLEELAFLYMMTEREVYGAEGKKLLLHLASMDPSGATSYRGAPEVAMRMLYFLPRAYSWLHDTMTEAERDIVRESVRVRGREAYNMIKGLPFETSPFSSHPGRMLGFLGQLSIAFLGEIPEAEPWLDYVVQLMFAVYPAWGGDDGGYSEGNGYWRAYMSWMFDFLDAFKAVTDIDLYQKPFFQNTGYYAMYTFSPGVGQPFSDGQNQLTGAADQSVMTHLARVHQNPYFAWYVSQIGTNQRSKILALLYQEPLPAAKAPTDLPGAWWFRDIGWVALHRDLAQPKENMQFTFKASPLGTASHSHSDQNAFVLYAYGDALAISSGYYPWSRSPHHESWTNQTLSKNSLLFDGRGQSIFSVDAAAQVLGLFHSDQYDYTAGDATSAYPDPNLKRYTRHVVYLRPDMFLLVDDVRAQRPVAVDWLLHSRFAINWNDEEQSAHITGRNSELDVYMLTPHGFSGSVTDQYNIPPETTSYQKEWHLTARLKEQVDEVAIVTLLSAKRLNAEGPEVLSANAEVEGDTVKVELTHRTDAKVTTEIIWVQLPPSGAAQVATVQAVAYDESGAPVKALSSGGTVDSTQGIIDVTPGWSVAARYDAANSAIDLTVGRTEAEAQRTTLDRSEGVTIVLRTPFAPTKVTVNGEVAPYWDTRVVAGETTVVW